MRARATTAARPRVADLRRLVHELQVHEIELEIQNEELVAARTDLEASLADYASLYDFAPVGYLSVGRDGSISRLNLAAARMLGGERSRLLERRLVLFFDARDRPELAVALDKTFADGVETTSEASLATDAAEAAEALRLRCTLAPADGGQECRVILADVTAQRRAEEQLGVAQKMDAVGRLAGGVAHEFNNLLTAIMSSAGYATECLAESHAAYAAVRDIAIASQRAGALTQQLLAFGRRQPVRPTRLDLNSLTTLLSPVLRGLIGANAELVQSLARDLRIVKADAAQVEQVLMNLVGNAGAALVDGHGTVTIETANAALDAERSARIFGAPPGVYVKITVRDTGAGIDDATRSRMFEPFFTTKGGASTGLGLSTVYGIVKQGGGDIAVTTGPGRGTAVTIYLPCAGPPSPVSLVPRPSPMRGRGETVLLVEDSRPVRVALERSLRTAGYRVLTAESGEDALRACAEQEGPVDVVLTDLRMPGMGGVELVRRLATVRPETRAIYMSGDPQGTAGFDPSAPYLAKPFTLEAMWLKIREVLDGRSPKAD